MTTQESNKLIAEFMDYPDLGNKGDFSYLKYHSSWDWLMPVVEKIEGEPHLCKVIIETNYCRVERNSGEHILTMGSQNLTKKEATYKAVVEFIKWYNKQKK